MSRFSRSLPLCLGRNERLANRGRHGCRMSGRRRSCDLAPADILAVVVSYNGGSKTVRTIEALAGQVGSVLVVDNASGAASRELLDALSGRADVMLHFLEQNRGISFALNHAVRVARERGYRWLLTMDQDSLADRNMIEEFR